jgi:hypothetical protein
MKPAHPTHYEIRVAGSLPDHWSDWFEGLTLTQQDGETLLTGPLADQAALYGLLRKIRDTGMMLIAVNPIFPHATQAKNHLEEQKMNTNKTTIETKNKKLVLAALWIFAVLNYLYCDVMTLMDSAFLKQFMEGSINGMKTTPAFFLGAAVLMEIPIAMVLLSIVLKHGANRWANIIAGTIMSIVQLSTLLAGSSTIYYLFFSIVEIASTLFIVGYAWLWRSVEA